ncbi:hypothetical protein MLD38_000767 [Melastoma candidum]|uniref:Uncharacterized protein n=1 Tax=Melastoma candidum TaxID=119954 RepID=A0ACB9SG29_9MYRT|nr:hypothetical protein MLD38_000767 [Melastoma candidum]
MGSLMAGWDSPFQDPKHVAYQRNRSFTKEAVDAYRRRKERSESDNDKYRRSSSVPPYSSAKEEAVLEIEAEVAWGKVVDGWWRRSNLAFLNEPPVLEGGSSNDTYVSQYHIASAHD